MNCPRCDDPLVEYELAGRAAVVCQACGYIGVAVDHRSEEETVESWAEALRRYKSRSAESGAEDSREPAADSAGGPTDESSVEEEASAEVVPAITRIEQDEPEVVPAIRRVEEEESPEVVPAITHVESDAGS